MMKKLLIFSILTTLFLTTSAMAPQATSWWVTDYQRRHPVAYVDGVPICKDFGDNLVTKRYPCHMTMEYQAVNTPKGLSYLYRIDGDVNWDAKVDVLDLLEILNNWGWVAFNEEDCAVGWYNEENIDCCNQADVTNDGIVNVPDLLEVLRDWGRESYGDCSCPVIYN